VARFLLDTTTVSHLMRKHSGVEHRMQALAPSHQVSTCTIVKGELRYGIERMASGRKRRHCEAMAAAVFHWLPCEGIPAAAADLYARIKAATERKGGRLDENDLWIAATALALGAVLVTADGDFGRVGHDLRIEDWTR